MNWGQIRHQVQLKHSDRSHDELNSWISEGYDAILLSRDWKLLEGNWKIPTMASYSTGTIEVTNGSTSITGTGVIWTLEMSDFTLKVGNDIETYTITYDSPTTAVLDRPYQGVTAATANYLLALREFRLPTDVRVVTKVYNPRISSNPIEEKDRSVLLGRAITLGEPYYYALDLSAETVPQHQRILVDPCPQVAGELLVDYTKQVEGFGGRNTDASPMPWVNPWAIVKWAQSLGYPAGSAERTGLMAEANLHLALMNRDENLRIPGTRIKPASRYTRHERKRRQW